MCRWVFINTNRKPMDKKIIVVLGLILTFAMNVYSQDSDDYKSLVLSSSKDLIELESGYSYYYLRSTDSFLVWFEGYTKRVFVHQVNSGQTKELPLSYGRGPGEVNSIRGLAIVNDTLIVLDARNSKLLVYDLNKQRYIKEFLIGTQRVSFIASSESKVFGRGGGREAVYYEIDHQNETITPIRASFDESIARDYVYNPYRSDGPFIANDDYLISFRNYEPSLFIYDRNKSVITDIIYDETEIITEYPKNEFGFASPPDRINLRITDSCILPDSGEVLIAANGKSKTKKFEKNILTKFDPTSYEYKGEIFTGLESVRHIACNSEGIYAYDDEQFIIKRIEY